MSSLVFAAVALGFSLLCWLTGTLRYLGPFIASAGVLASVPAPALRPALGAAAIAYVACAAAGALAHALVPPHPLTLVALAAALFWTLRRAGQSHAPALAMFALVFMNGFPLG